MAEMTSLERLVHEQLKRAGKGREATAITLSWRAMTLRALSTTLSGRNENHLVVLATIAHAAELYGYTLLNASLAANQPMICFARQGITEVMQYFDWCHVFFDHLGVIAQDLPAPASSALDIESVARANAAILKNMLEELCDESGKVDESEAQARAQGHAEAMGTISISAQTFLGLGRALSSVICAWFTATERTQFMEQVAQGTRELTELHDLVRIHVNERGTEPDTATAQSTAASDISVPEK